MRKARPPPSPPPTPLYRLRSLPLPTQGKAEWHYYRAVTRGEGERDGQSRQAKKWGSKVDGGDREKRAEKKTRGK
jgi:hypothetical protein